MPTMKRIATDTQIVQPGSYRVHLRIGNAAKFAAKHDGRKKLKYKIVERWFNNSAEVTNLFDRWADDGVDAMLGRFVGR